MASSDHRSELEGATGCFGERRPDEPNAERVLRRLVSELSSHEFDVNENGEEVDLGEPPPGGGAADEASGGEVTEQSDCDGSEYSDNLESDASGEEELVEAADELLPPCDDICGDEPPPPSDLGGPDVPPPYSLPRSTYPASNLPPRTGIAIPMLSTQPKFCQICPTEPEPLAPSNEALFDDIVRQEAERIAHPELVRNRTVYDSVDVNPERPEAHVTGIVDELPQYYVPTGLDDVALVFESRFESGNLRRAVQVYENEYDLILNPDYNTKSHTQWYFFSVANTRKGPTYRFNIINMVKPTSVYNEGMRPLCHSMLDADLKGVGWRRCGADIAYYQNGIRRKDKGMNYYTLTFTMTFDHDGDQVFFSHCFPYTYTDLQLYLKELEADPKRSQRFRRRKLCETLAGNACDLLTITSFTGDPLALKARRAVVISARVHPGESNASWMMKGVIDYLTGPSLDARILRDNFVFKLIPMLNPDGCIVGNYRCSLAGQDLNRQWADPSRKLHPTIFFAKNMIRRLMDDREVILYIDIHGHSRKKNIFMYGNSQGRSTREKIFPRLISKTSDCFNFDECNFKIQRGKESTARVVVYRELNIINSFTLEASFCGADFGPHADTHFTTRHLEEVGHMMCDTILDFCDPDQSKVMQICRELQQLYPDDGASDDVSDSEADDPPPMCNGMRGKKKDRKNQKKEKPKKKRAERDSVARASLEDDGHRGSDARDSGSETWDAKARGKGRTRPKKDKRRSDADDPPACPGSSSQGTLQASLGGGSDAERWGSSRRTQSTDAARGSERDAADAKARRGSTKKKRKESSRPVPKAEASSHLSSARGGSSGSSQAIRTQGSMSHGDLRNPKKGVADGDLSESGADHRTQGSKAKEIIHSAGEALRDASPAGVARRSQIKKVQSVRLPGAPPYQAGDSPRHSAQPSQPVQEGLSRPSELEEKSPAANAGRSSAVFPPLLNNGRRTK